MTPIKNPKETGEYIDCEDNGKVLQSTRKASLFSADGGRSWYDIDRSPPRWKRLFGVRRAFVSFPLTQ